MKFIAIAEFSSQEFDFSGPTRTIEPGEEIELSDQTLADRLTRNGWIKAAVTTGGDDKDPVPA